MALAGLAGRPPAAPRPGAGSVGVYEDDLLQPVARDCRRAVRLAAEALAAAGHELVEERPPRQEEIRGWFDLLVGSELAAPLASSTAGREDGLSRYGRMVVESASGLDVPLAVYLEAWTRLGILEREVDEWFERRRLALCPVAPGPAPPIGEASPRSTARRCARAASSRSARSPTQSASRRRRFPCCALTTACRSASSSSVAAAATSR